ncbi:hypothetical protein, partial [Salmonella enterica]|uniref:hypothetical protein n=1 Tax=Salmonella enterica TaxID=28901 RepID=UPI003F4C82CB
PPTHPHPAPPPPLLNHKTTHPLCFFLVCRLAVCGPVWLWRRIKNNPSPWAPGPLDPTTHPPPPPK